MRAAPLPCDAVAHELDIDVILIGRPMALEIVEEARPVGQQPVRLEIAQRKRKAVVDADQRGRIFGEPFHQPFGNALAGPVFARARWRRNFLRRRLALGQIDAQALEARGRRFRARIVDADGAGEGGHRVIAHWQRIVGRRDRIAFARLVNLHGIAVEIWIGEVRGSRRESRSA